MLVLNLSNFQFCWRTWGCVHDECAVLKRDTVDVVAFFSFFRSFPSYSCFKAVDRLLCACTIPLCCFSRGFLIHLRSDTKSSSVMMSARRLLNQFTVSVKHAFYCQAAPPHSSNNSINHFYVWRIFEGSPGVYPVSHFTLRVDLSIKLFGRAVPVLNLYRPREH